MGSSEERNWMERRPVLFAVVGAISAAAITGTVTWAVNHDGHADAQLKPTQAVRTAPTGKITSPDTAKVGNTVHLSGWIKDVPKGYALWAYNQKVSSGKLWPEYGPCLIHEDKTSWDCPDLLVDGKGEVPAQERRVRVALVTAQDAVDIEAYVIAREYKNEHPDGFSNLPADAIPIDEMKVIRE